MISCHKPTTLTVIPTFKCTAACRDCCFECSPKVDDRIDSDELLDIIFKAKNTFSSLKLLVVSGGECFLLGDDLEKIVKESKKYGFAVRCVTNAYWALNEIVANKKIIAMKKSGLSELNISTGNNHSQYVPVENVIYAAYASVVCGIQTTIVIESAEENIKLSIKNNDYYKKIESSPRLNSLLNIISSVWVESDKKILKKIPRDINIVKSSHHGCENIFDSMTITPDKNLYACCGLSMLKIKEMKLGSLTFNDIHNLYTTQFDDFLKIWLYVDGPHKIIYYLSSVYSDIDKYDDIKHPCDCCNLIYSNDNIKEKLIKVYNNKINDIIFRYFLKVEYSNRASNIRKQSA